MLGWSRYAMDREKYAGHQPPSMTACRKYSCNMLVCLFRIRA